MFLFCKVLFKFVLLSRGKFKIIKNRILETLNLLTYHISCVMCHLSPVTCHLSQVTFHQHQHPQPQTPPANTPTLHSMLVCQKQESKAHFFLLQNHNNCWNLKKKEVLSFAILAISSLTCTVQLLPFWLSTEETDKQQTANGHPDL